MLEYFEIDNIKIQNKCKPYVMQRTKLTLEFSREKLNLTYVFLNLLLFITSNL